MIASFVLVFLIAVGIMSVVKGEEEVNQLLNPLCRHLYRLCYVLNLTNFCDIYQRFCASQPTPSQTLP